MSITPVSSGVRGLSLSRSRLPLVAAIGVAALAAGPANASAAGGSAAVAWGENFHTQLGAGYKSNHETSPVTVVGLTKITATAAGYHFSLALLEDGTVRSWGGNDFGQ